MQPTPSDPKKKKPADDDRNLVVVDKDFADADIEDRVWLFWKRHRFTIISTIIVVAVVVIGASVYGVWQKQRTASMQEAYQNAQTAEALAAFAEDYKGQALAAVAAVQLADEAYKAGDFARAAAGYASALSDLKPAPMLQQRVRLGQAIALIRAGQDPKAEKLIALAQDTSVYDAYRAQADYQLALIAVEAKDYVAARSWIEQLAALPQAGIWAERAQMLVSLKPEILKAE